MPEKNEATQDHSRPDTLSKRSTWTNYVRQRQGPIPKDVLSGKRRKIYQDGWQSMLQWSTVWINRSEELSNRLEITVNPRS